MSTSHQPHGAAEKLEAVLSILRGEKTPDEVVASLRITPGTLRTWQAALLEGARVALEGTDEATEPTARAGNLAQFDRGTTFVGRRREADEVRDLLGASRSVTLTGPGGVGKTRLALYVGERVQRLFSDGAWMVDLAEVTEGSSIPAVVLESMRLRAPGAQRPQEALLEELRRQHALILLDNCEHVVDAVADLVAGILRAAPNVRILATSREALNIPGERVWSVPPLSISPKDSAVASPSEQEALELLRQRAAEVLPGFVIDDANRDSATRLCSRLDGIPLAIELAAVRLRALGLDQLVNQLENHFEALPTVRRGEPHRHQTLRGAVQWSHSLCTDPERDTWARLSVLRGGFTIDAAIAVCADMAEPQATIDTVATLVDKSVIVIQQQGSVARYRMLETIRQFGAEQLHARALDEVAGTLHFEHFLTLAARAKTTWSSAGQVEALTALRSERPNFRAALAFGFEGHPDPLAGAALVAALRYLWVCGSSREGRLWVDRALRVAQDTPSAAELLLLSGWLRQLDGDWSGSRKDLQACIAHAERDGDEELVLHARQFLGIDSLLAHDLDVALDQLTRALAEYRTGSRPWDAMSLLGLAALGWVHLELGDDLAAATACAEACNEGERLGEQWARSWALWVMGLRGWINGTHDETRRTLRTCVRLKFELNDWFGLPCALEVLAWDLVATGDDARAAFLLGANQRLWPEIGRPLFGFEAFMSRHSACMGQLRERLGDEALAREMTAGAHASPDAVIERALDENRSKDAGTRRESRGPLTRREHQVATLVSEGLSNREIAERLVVSLRTAETHVENILTKLGFRSRRQIGDWIVEHE